MKNLVKVTFVLFLTLFISCSDDDTTEGIVSNQPLQGKVFGGDFTALGGKSFESGSKVSINITNVAADCSSTIFDYDSYISTEVTAKVGVYNNVNVAFHKKGETVVNVIQSTVEITSITDSQIMVKVKSNSSTSNVVDGIFTVSYCK